MKWNFTLLLKYIEELNIKINQKFYCTAKIFGMGQNFLVGL